MATYHSRECSDIEDQIKSYLPLNWEVECGKDFDTKGYIIVVAAPAKYHKIVITAEEFREGHWSTKVRRELDAIESHSVVH